MVYGDLFGRCLLVSRKKRVPGKEENRSKRKVKKVGKREKKKEKA